MTIVWLPYIIVHVDAKSILDEIHNVGNVVHLVAMLVSYASAKALFPHDEWTCNVIFAVILSFPYLMIRVGNIHDQIQQFALFVQFLSFVGLFVLFALFAIFLS